MGLFETHFVTYSRYDVENNGRVDGKIPVKDFEKILEENVLWVEKVPADVRANIIALTLPPSIHPMMVVVLAMYQLYLSNQFKIEVFQFS